MKALCTPNYGGELSDAQIEEINSVYIDAGFSLEKRTELLLLGAEEFHFFCKENPEAAVPPDLKASVEPKLTALNKVGMFFVAGTECRCCLGWRIAVLSACVPIAFMLGVLYA